MYDYDEVRISVDKQKLKKCDFMAKYYLESKKIHTQPKVLIKTFLSKIFKRLRIPNMLNPRCVILICSLYGSLFYVYCIYNNIAKNLE